MSDQMEIQRRKFLGLTTAVGGGSGFSLDCGWPQCGLAKGCAQGNSRDCSADCESIWNAATERAGFLSCVSRSVDR